MQALETAKEIINTTSKSDSTVEGILIAVTATTVIISGFLLLILWKRLVQIQDDKTQNEKDSILIMNEMNNVIKDLSLENKILKDKINLIELNQKRTHDLIIQNIK